MAASWLSAESETYAHDLALVRAAGQRPAALHRANSLREGHRRHARRMPPGEVWPLQTILDYKARVEAAGLTLDVIESIAVPEAVKRACRNAISRSRLTPRVCATWAAPGCVCCATTSCRCSTGCAARCSIPCRTTRSSPATARGHGSLRPAQGFEARVAWSKGYSGDELRALMAAYDGIGEDGLLENLRYFLDGVIPAAEEAGVYLAIHPDDPPWTVLGLPRIVRDAESIQRILNLNPSPHNGITFCSGSLGASAANDLPAMVRHFAERIHFVHLRNVKVEGDRIFHEVAHPSECGTVDMLALMQALADIDYCGSAPARSWAAHLGRGRATHRLRPLRPGYGRDVSSGPVGGGSGKSVSPTSCFLTQ